MIRKGGAAGLAGCLGTNGGQMTPPHIDQILIVFEVGQPVLPAVSGSTEAR